MLRATCALGLSGDAFVRYIRRTVGIEPMVVGARSLGTVVLGSV